MPELPEVEHVRRNLVRWLHGARIVSAQSFDRNIVRATPRAFAERLRGCKVDKVERRGKWLRWTLDDGTKLFAHLGMTGDFVAGTSDERMRHERARFNVERHGTTRIVHYTDTRRWGRILVSRDDTDTWSKLGPDPLNDGIDLNRLLDKLARTKRTIKESIMDQTILAGIGNIQAIEALWKARIHPKAPARLLSAKQVKALIAGLEWTIERTLADLAKGDEGADNPFRIYGRKGEPCPRCKTPLDRFVLGGRTTTVCPSCQAP